MALRNFVLLEKKYPANDRPDKRLMNSMTANRAFNILCNLTGFTLSGFFYVMLFFCVLVGWIVYPVSATAQTPLPQETLVDLVKPSIVRIAGHITGLAKIPEIKVDIRKRLVAVVPGEYIEVPVNEYMMGSGFIIHPDGYIATSAHVVSQETVKQMLASESALSALYENALFLSDAEMQDFIQSENDNGFGKQVIKYVIEQSVFELESVTVVLRPNSEKRNIDDLISEGFPTEIISVNNDFWEDEKDVALLKVEETHLPALSLGDGEELVVGKRAYIFGFPATAELNRNSASEATFTQGVISAIRQSVNRDFKIFQTDAKVSAGSSGGPLFNEFGNVTGIITFQTDELSRGQGDNFAFALPIVMIKDAAQEANISFTEGTYSRYFKRGFKNFTSGKCDKATEDFRIALNESNNVFVMEDYLAVYLRKCEELQERKRFNNFFGTWLDNVRNISNPLFYLIGVGLIIFGIFGGVLFWILRLVRREEKEIETLEARLRMDEARIKRYDSMPHSDVLLKRESTKKRKK